MDEPYSFEPENTVLVVGGGMAGIQTAMDLADAGRQVLIVDQSPAIGGLMTRLDRTFPTNNCDLCTLSPNLSEGNRKDRIHLLEMSQVEEVSGDPGDFQVTIRTAPRHIDLERCTACGECREKYPDAVRFTPGLDHRAPTCMRYPQATPHAYSIDMGKCEDVEGLVASCPAEAILPEEQEREQTVRCGAVVLATGGEVNQPFTEPFLGYGVWPDVVTGLEYERILSATGPSQGRLERPSDGKPPARIAWIQCVGSRGLRQDEVSYCSSICCMSSIKEAVVTKERFGDSIEATIFYMDMRTSGKDFEMYYQRAREELGVRFVRCRTDCVLRDAATGQFNVRYFTPDGNEGQVEPYDMVVLATGFRVTDEVRALTDRLGVDVNQHGFVKTTSFKPLGTSRPGIFAAGVCQGPNDIPATLVQASGAAAEAARHLAPPPAEDTDLERFPPERSVEDEPPKVGVFVCDCGTEIGGVVDVPKLVGELGALGSVAHAEGIGYGCSRASMERIQAAITEHGLNRVVIGGCSPRTHEKKFQDTLRMAGLNPFVLDIANLRDQTSWVHFSTPERAYDKAGDLLRMSIAAVRKKRPLPHETVQVNRAVLVLGGGVAGMTAATQLADAGFKVHLVERERQLGGHAAKLFRSLAGEDIQAFVKELVQRTQDHPNVEVITEALVVDHSGVPGKLTTGMQVGRQTTSYRQIHHGITVLATGALANRPKEYGLGEHPGVLTQRELDEVLELTPEQVKDWKTVVMIQCVGSRVPENPNCSRICCQSAVKNALRLLDQDPDRRIVVLYRDMRTLGTDEDAYLEARRRGVLFAPYDLDHKPQVEFGEDGTTVTFRDAILQDEIRGKVDGLVLSTGFLADDEATEKLAAIFHLPRTHDGYFLEDHVKLRPVDLSMPGFFVAGTAHGPKSIPESVAQAQAVAARAQALLARQEIVLDATVARVDANRCAACLVCVRACPYGVPFINADGHSEIDPALCHGCGVCAAECPAKAIQLTQFEDEQISAKLQALLTREIA